MKIKADSTGTVMPTNKEFKAKVEALCIPEMFDINIYRTATLTAHLTTDEIARLDRKLLLVKRFALLMAVGMLKGTLKFPNDAWTLDQWMASALGKGADFANYINLMVDEYEKE